MCTFIDLKYILFIAKLAHEQALGGPIAVPLDCLYYSDPSNSVRLLPSVISRAFRMHSVLKMGPRCILFVHCILVVHYILVVHLTLYIFTLPNCLFLLHKKALKRVRIDRQL